MHDGQTHGTIVCISQFRRERLILNRGGGEAGAKYHCFNSWLREILKKLQEVRLAESPPSAH